MRLKVELSGISRWRTELMGIAAIMILICHSVVAKVQMPAFLIRIVVYGNLGVDVFLLLSGFGMCYSCQNVDSGGGNIRMDWVAKASFNSNYNAIYDNTWSLLDY